MTDLTAEQQAVVAAAAAFARDVIEWAWGEEDPITPDEVNELAAEHGLINVRKPTQAEFDDTTWWGHAAGIPIDGELVELVPAFESALAIIEEPAQAEAAE